MKTSCYVEFDPWPRTAFVICSMAFFQAQEQEQEQEKMVAVEEEEEEEEESSSSSAAEVMEACRPHMGVEVIPSFSRHAMAFFIAHLSNNVVLVWQETAESALDESEARSEKERNKSGMSEPCCKFIAFAPVV